MMVTHKRMKMKKLITALFCLAPMIALGNPPGSNEVNGGNCLENCGHTNNNGGGNGGNGQGGNGTGGSSSATGTGVGIAGAAAGSSSGSSSNASATASNVASGGNGNQTMEGSNYRSLSLSGGSVGSPDVGTCVAHFSALFGMVTAPIVMSDCTAERQSRLLWDYGLKEAAVSRLCSIKEVRATGICPPEEKKGEDK